MYGSLAFFSLCPHLTSSTPPAPQSSSPSRGPGLGLYSPWMLKDESASLLNSLRCIQLRLQPNSASWASGMTQHPCLASLRSPQPCVTKDSLTIGGRGLLYCLPQPCQGLGPPTPHRCSLTQHSSSYLPGFLPCTICDSGPKPVTQNLSLLFVLGLTQQTYSSLCLGCHSQSV